MKEEREPLSLFLVALLGFVPVAAAAGAVALIRYLAGSWQTTFEWIFGGVLWLAGLGVVGLISMGIGAKLWFGSIDTIEEGKGGLSLLRDQRAERKVEKARARQAAKLQDGQVSVAGDEHGRVSMVGGK